MTRKSDNGTNNSSEDFTLDPATLKQWHDNQNDTDSGKVSWKTIVAARDANTRVKAVAETLGLPPSATQIAQAVALGTVEAGKILRRS